MPDTIEIYEHKGEGYAPFLIRDGWQVAQLNHTAAQGMDGIRKLDMHRLTDEAFILLRGRAVLIGATIDAGGKPAFRCVRMEHGLTYNIPVNTWHNIAMDKDASVIIMERDGTHLGDFVFLELTADQQCALKAMISEILK
ncbi:hypothetical protein Q4E93_16530 [Flavitalea sp. BT771]|uniref:hypothetical protein n=1 Tax=Flavitalea sp. BT771 TaxID=3063329 RepID=UPI0026E4318B|nr:hypothetical protein [Flavitalea sp. BT771]MDO6432209.1 hypothetical protein [Flavitalea sp. BT771]MDV6221119.1 hypothetical protein [Flavitalea sp. BT771]